MRADVCQTEYLQSRTKTLTGSIHIEIPRMTELKVMKRDGLARQTLMRLRVRKL